MLIVYTTFKGLKFPSFKYKISTLSEFTEACQYVNTVFICEDLKFKSRHLHDNGKARK